MFNTNCQAKISCNHVIANAQSTHVPSEAVLNSCRVFPVLKETLAIIKHFRMCYDILFVTSRLTRNFYSTMDFVIILAVSHTSSGVIRPAMGGAIGYFPNKAVGRGCYQSLQQIIVM